MVVFLWSTLTNTVALHIYFQMDLSHPCITTHNYNSQGMISTWVISRDCISWCILLGFWIHICHGAFSLFSRLWQWQGRLLPPIVLLFIVTTILSTKTHCNYIAEELRKKASHEYKPEFSYKFFPTVSGIGYWYIHLVAFWGEDWLLVSRHDLFTEGDILSVLRVIYTISTNCLACLNVRQRRGCSAVSTMRHRMICPTCCKWDGEAEYGFKYWEEAAACRLHVLVVPTWLNGCLGLNSVCP